MSRIIRHTKDIKKHSAFILTVDATYIENATARTSDGLVNVFSQPINRYPSELFLEDAQSYLAIREREWCDNSVAYVFNELARDLQVGPYLTNAKGEKKEGDPKYRQLLPYMIARQLQDDGSYLYFPYKRTKQVGESRLAGNGSLGYGGHIDLEDIVSTKSVIDLKATILKSSLREAVEEFTMSSEVFGDHRVTAGMYADAISFGDLFIVDNSNDVGELHLGIIMYFDVPQGWHLEASEDELAKLPPMTAEQMLADQSFNPENWTKIYLDFVIAEAEADAVQTDEFGLEKELVDVESEEDLPELAAEGSVERIAGFLKDAVDNTLSLDHGGVQVGTVDAQVLEGLAAQAPVSEAAALANAVEVNPDAIQSTIPADWSLTDTLIGKNDAVPVFGDSNKVEEKQDAIKVSDDGAAY